MELFKRSHLITLESMYKFYRAPLNLVEEESPQEPVEDPTEADYQDEEPEETPTPESEENLIISISKISETSPEFDEKVKEGLGTISKDIRKLLLDSGYSVVVTALLSDATGPDIAQKSMIPWNMVSSVTLFKDHQVVIAASTVDSNGGSIDSLNPQGLLRVEVGHVLNSLASEYISSDKGFFSDLDGFKYAHTSDIARLASDKKQKLAFYVGDNDASRSECFAECFAALNGGGAVYTMEVMSKYFPAVLKQMKDIMNSIKSGSNDEESPEEDNSTPEVGEES